MRGLVLHLPYVTRCPRHQLRSCVATESPENLGVSLVNQNTPTFISVVEGEQSRRSHTLTHIERHNDQNLGSVKYLPTQRCARTQNEKIEVLFNSADRGTSTFFQGAKMMLANTEFSVKCLRISADEFALYIEVQPGTVRKSCAVTDSYFGFQSREVVNHRLA